MKITGLRTFVANVPRTNFVFVKFYTDEAIDSVGEATDVPWRKELVNETLVFEDGHLLAPTAPGLGVELKEEACTRFPYAPHDVPLFDGSINLSGIATGAVVMGKVQL